MPWGFGYWLDQKSPLWRPNPQVMKASVILCTTRLSYGCSVVGQVATAFSPRAFLLLLVS